MESDEIIMTKYDFYVIIKMILKSMGGIYMQTANVAADVVRLFESQTPGVGSVRLQSMKVVLPNGCDAEEVSKYIIDHYPQYKAHAKESEKAPMLAIGHR